MGANGPDTDRTAVQTYVPGYQKDEWVDDADHMEMSLSEFVRTMVQAGRRGFIGPESTADEDPSSPTPEPSGEIVGLHGFIESALTGSEYRSWDDLVDELEDALQHLQDANRVTYSGRQGGYTLTDE